MKIGPQPDIPTSVTAQTQSATSKVIPGLVAKATQDANSAGVAVTVSTLARSLEVANRGEPADVDMEKVNAIRTAIEQGTFTVNPEAIADQLLANAQEMLNRTRS